MWGQNKEKSCRGFYLINFLFFFKDAGMKSHQTIPSTVPLGKMLVSTIRLSKTYVSRNTEQEKVPHL